MAAWILGRNSEHRSTPAFGLMICPCGGKSKKRLGPEMEAKAFIA
jgi:hypothetical protein